jgi:tRNA pseudouridine38-40 synthase
MRIALALEYDGAGFFGWQSQAGGNTVQDALELALAQIATHPVRTHAAGRTDTGVHALCQVVHFDTHTSRPMTAWVRGVNAFLPASIRVLWAHAVPDSFHARFSAQGRSYQYCLVNSAVAPAILAHKVGWFHQPLEVQAMQQAVAHLLGEHDFSAFRAAGCQAKSPIKTLSIASVSAQNQHIVFSFAANAFLHHQVRNMVGALVYIGKGKYAPDYIKTLLSQKNRTLAPPTFSPHGLYLTGVKYDEIYGLPLLARTLNFSLS